MSVQHILHANKFGIVKQCSCCRQIQLTLGSVVLHLSEKEFYLLKQSFFELNDIQDVQLHASGKIKRYLLNTCFASLSLSLSEKEYSATCALFTLSEVILKVNKTLNKSLEN